MTTMTTSRETAYTIEQALDPRNVHDQFKGMNDDIIRGEQETRRIPLITIALNLSHDFNKSTVARTASAMATRKFYFLNKPNNQKIGHPEGTKHWDKRGAVGVQNYNSYIHYDINRYQELFDELHADGYTIYAVDNIPGYDAKIVYDVELPERTVFVMGEEGLGIPEEIVRATDGMIFLGMHGVSPRSYNVSVAHGMVCGEYMRQHRHLFHL